MDALWAGLRVENICLKLRLAEWAKFDMSASSRGADISNLDASLLAHYTFDNGDATDSSGYGNNGITHGNPNFC